MGELLKKLLIDGNFFQTSQKISLRILIYVFPQVKNQKFILIS